MKNLLKIVSAAQTPSYRSRRQSGFFSSNTFLLHCAVGIIAALLICGVGLLLKLSLLIMGLLYILLVMSFAVRCGFWQSVVVSIVCLICEGFFFAEHGAGSYVLRDAFSLLVFEITAVMVGRVSSREVAQAAESDRDRRRTQRLYSVSHDVLLLNPQDPPERQIAEFIVKEFELEGTAVVNDLLGSVGGAGCWAGSEAVLREQLSQKRSKVLEEASQRPLVSVHGRVGTLLVRGDISDLALDSLASLVVLALERHRAYMKEGAAEAARKTEQLRTTVLDGLAHAIKTPLTIIRAASSGLLEVGNMDETQGQLAQMIDEQSVRIDELTSRLLQTARIEGEHLTLQIEAVDVEELIYEVVREIKREWLEPGDNTSLNHEINVSLRQPVLPIAADHEMLSTTLKELLTNAMKYSHPGSPIAIGVADSTDELRFSIRSYGAVIPVEEHQRVFETFYRSPTHKHSTPGTGLGLSVARRVTEAHGGHIWFTSADKEGTTFYLSLSRQFSNTFPSQGNTNHL